MNGMVPVEHESPIGKGLSQAGTAAIGRQIKLPLSKAFEISFNSVRTRKWRSLITSSGIVLAIAFLMATVASGKTIAAIKTGLPQEISREQDLQAFGSAELSQGIEVLFAIQPGLKTDPRFKKVQEALGRAEFAQAQERLTQAIAQSPPGSATAQMQALDDRMRELLAATVKLETFEKLRLAMLKRGANLSASSEAAGALAAGKESTAAEARERWLVVLALVVALVGIMNSMLMSVTERFREIGTMKCLGALDNFIVKLFLIESSVQGLLGTLAGILLGLALSAAKIWYDYDAIAWDFLPWTQLGKWALISLGIGTGLAFVGALAPAYFAAKMEPVVAMRQDQ